MSPASGDFQIQQPPAVFADSFHSINVPSEWGRLAYINSVNLLKVNVSIQLMSPASGDLNKRPYWCDEHIWKVSIQLMSPASGDSSS